MTGQHAVVVLAAGGSTRLGRPKQLLTRNGETLIRRAVRLAAETSPCRLLVVIGASAEVVVPELETAGCEIIDNREWRDGLASSLRAAAAALVGFDGTVLVLACDQPALASRHLNALLEGLHSAPYEAAATHYDDVSGIPAVVPSAWFSHRDLCGDRGFGRLLRALPRSALFVIEAPDFRLDIDSPQDVTDAIARGWLDSFEW